MHIYVFDNYSYIYVFIDILLFMQWDNSSIELMFLYSPNQRKIKFLVSITTNGYWYLKTEWENHIGLQMMYTDVKQ